jgi:hypothetical protein
VFDEGRDSGLAPFFIQPPIERRTVRVNSLS